MSERKYWVRFLLGFALAVAFFVALTTIAIGDDLSDLRAENKLLWYVVSAAAGGLGSYLVVYGKLSAINAKLDFLEKHHTENTAKIASVEAFGLKTREDLNKTYPRIKALEEKAVSNHGGKL